MQDISSYSEKKYGLFLPTPPIDHLIQVIISLPRGTESLPLTDILKPSSNRSLYKLVIFDQTLLKLRLFLPIYVHLNGQTFSSVFEQFFYFIFFFG